MSNIYRTLKSLSGALSLHWPHYEKRALFVLFLVALVARFSIIYWVMGLDYVSHDTRGYETIAQNLLTEQIFLDPGGNYAYRPPVYPLFLALVYGVFGFRNYLALKLIESAISALTCIMIYLVGKKIWGWPIGLVGAAIATFYPFFLFSTGTVLTENLFTFLLMIVIYFLLQAERSPLLPLWQSKSIYYLIMGGFLLGLSTLTRPYIVLLVPLLFLWAILAYDNLQSALIGGGIVVGITVLTILPWTIRNYIIFQELVPLSTNGGYAFWAGNNSVVVGTGRYVSPRDLPGVEDFDSWPEVERNRRGYQEGLSFVQENPDLWGPLYVAKLRNFWNIMPDRGTRDRLASLFSYGLLFPFFWIGLILAATYPQKPWLLWFVIAVTTLNALIFFGTIRFRYPIEPLIILFAVLGLSRFIRVINAIYRRYQIRDKVTNILP